MREKFQLTWILIGLGAVSQRYYRGSWKENDSPRSLIVWFGCCGDLLYADSFATEVRLLEAGWQIIILVLFWFDVILAFKTWTLLFMAINCDPNDFVSCTVSLYIYVLQIGGFKRKEWMFAQVSIYLRELESNTIPSS